MVPVSPRVLKSPLGIGRHMARERGQTGTVFVKGTRVKKWYGRFHIYVKDAAGRERRQFRKVILGLVAEMSKRDAKRELQQAIDREAGSPYAKPDPKTLFDWFVRERFLPMRRDRWKPSTLSRTLNLYKKHVIPSFEGVPLSKLNRFACQQWLNGKAGLSKSVVLKCNIHLRAVLDEAVAQGYLDRNPAVKLEIPRYAKPNERHLLLAEAQKVLGALVSPRDHLILRIHLLCGLRPGETFALRWNDVSSQFLRIDEAVNIGRHKKGEETVSTKTETSTAPVVLPVSLAEEIERWRMIQQPASSDEFLFPSVHAGKPMSYNTYLHKVLQPIAAGVGVHGLTFQSLRRTFATLAQRHGMPKDLQTQIRHADPATTLRIYAKQIPESVAEMVEALDKELGQGKEPSKA